MNEWSAAGKVQGTWTKVPGNERYRERMVLGGKGLQGLFVLGKKMNVHFRLFLFSAVNGISFSSEFSFRAENEICFSVGV